MTADRPRWWRRAALAAPALVGLVVAAPAAVVDVPDGQRAATVAVASVAGLVVAAGWYLWRWLAPRLGRATALAVLSLAGAVAGAVAGLAVPSVCSQLPVGVVCHRDVQVGELLLAGAATPPTVALLVAPPAWLAGRVGRWLAGRHR